MVVASPVALMAFNSCREELWFRIHSDTTTYLRFPLKEAYQALQRISSGWQKLKVEVQPT